MGLKCRYCNSKNTRVTCTRDYKNFLKKYKRCLDCNKTFRTIETYEQPKPGPVPGTPRTRNICMGESHPMSTFTDNDIIAMRQLWNEGQTLTAIAKRYGISRPHVSNIVNYRAWKHVP